MSIKVLVIDDSALVRNMLSEIINSNKDMHVVGVASDPIMARDKIKQLNPDVLTLDVEMPRMDGLEFLEKLMRLRPMPVVMVSSLTEQGADITLRAMELGAIDFVSKPKIDLANTLTEYAQEIAEKIRTAAVARPRTLSGAARSVATMEIVPKLSADAVLGRTNNHSPFRTTDRIIALGASTGGTEAIKEVLMRMPADAPGMVITQHIPGAFSGPFANRMNSISAMTVCEVTDGQPIVPGHAYIAPGNKHLLVRRDGARYVCQLSDGPPVNRHRPSVDVMFRSVAQNVGSNALGVILTGMGDDGARGMKEMHEAGAYTFAQDEKSSVVWGMPGEAVKHGGVDEVIPLSQVARKLCSAYSKAFVA